jgi:osmotically-inducible protein OsmY
MTDLDIRDAVLAAIKEAAGDIDCAAIGVAVHRGVVTLSGRADSFAAKAAASRVALRAEGVRGVANEIDVCGEDESYVADEVIAAQIADYLRKKRSGDRLNVRVAVSHGAVTLSGALDDERHRAALCGFAQALEGVERVNDHLTLRSGHAA